MVKIWFTEFRCDRRITKDVKRSGRPDEVSTPETIENVDGMVVLADRRFELREIVEAIGI